MREGIGSDISDLVTDPALQDELQTLCLEFVSRSLMPEQFAPYRLGILDIIGDYLTENNHVVQGIIVHGEKVKLRFRGRVNPSVVKDLYVCDLPPTIFESNPDSYNHFIPLI